MVAAAFVMQDEKAGNEVQIIHVSIKDQSLSGVENDDTTVCVDLLHNFIFTSWLALQRLRLGKRRQRKGRNTLRAVVSTFHSSLPGPGAEAINCSRN